MGGRYHTKRDIWSGSEGATVGSTANGFGKSGEEIA